MSLRCLSTRDPSSFTSPRLQIPVQPDQIGGTGSLLNHLDSDGDDRGARLPLPRPSPIARRFKHISRSMQLACHGPVVSLVTKMENKKPDWDPARNCFSMNFGGAFPTLLDTSSIAPEP